MGSLQNELIIYLSSIDWDFNWQTHQEIASALARQGNLVLYVENTGVRVPRLSDLPRLGQRLRNWRRSVGGIRQVAERLYVSSPLLLPFPYSRTAHWLNRWLLAFSVKRWMKIVGFRRPLVWTYLPTRLTIGIINELDPALVIYYCVADFRELAPRHKVSQTERELLKRADVVFAQGELLAERCREVNRNVSVFPGGVNTELFQAAETAEVPEDLKSVARPRLGYVGALQRHVDYELLESIARHHPEWSLVLIGPKQQSNQSLHTLPNVVWLGQRSHAEIPRYIAHLDICLIPYQLTPYTSTVYPAKLNEYLIMGKPVVSTALPEIVSFNGRHGGIVAVGGTPEEFERCIVESLQSANGELVPRRRAVALEYSWPTRITRMTTHLVEALEQKQAIARREWSVTFRRWHRQTRVRLVRLVGITLLLYALAFHSPLLWWLALPLTSGGSLRPADAIVVFAGGVGESGRAGQGYVERVERAAELYQNRLAGSVVFSSGYVYALNETDVMKSLAVSLGIPPSAIVLETQARNTWENVHFTAAIAHQRGWHSLLLVSSPYHMRRSLLVFQKDAPDLRIIPAAVLHSIFFEHARGVKPQQWRAILHEYAGMLYYWWKGWL